MWEDKLATLIFWLNVQSLYYIVNVSLLVHECVLLLKGIILCTVILSLHSLIHNFSVQWGFPHNSPTLCWIISHGQSERGGSFSSKSILFDFIWRSFILCCPVFVSVCSVHISSFQNQCRWIVLLAVKIEFTSIGSALYVLSDPQLQVEGSLWMCCGLSSLQIWN